MKETIKLHARHLENLCRACSRGMYFYHKLNSKKISSYMEDTNTIPEMCFYIRALAEVTAGLNYWFKSKENIHDIDVAIFLDQQRLIAGFSKLAERFPDRVTNDMSDFKNNHADFYSRFKYALINKKRTEDFDYQIAFDITSKLIHQDEMSIFSLSQSLFVASEPNEQMPFRDMLLSQAHKWRSNFQSTVVTISERFPQFLPDYNLNYSSRNYSKITKNFLGTSK